MAARLAPLPLSASDLARYRLDCRRLLRVGLSGSHATRRRGQSLEFRDFASYAPGDDARYIDWQASARSGGLHDIRNWRVRNYAAEETITLAVSVDGRNTMRLPTVASKWQAALWVAEAIARVVLGGRTHSQDRVLLHNLSLDEASTASSVIRLNRRAHPSQIHEHMARWMTTKPSDTWTFSRLIPDLPPTSIWVVLTDFYFIKEAKSEFVRRLTTSCTGNRWVMVLELDSWAYEATPLLGGKAGRLDDPGGDKTQKYFDGDSVQEARLRIESHKEDIRRGLEAGGVKLMSPWRWPDTFQGKSAPAEWFRTCFTSDKELRKIFARES